ncbi:MAG: cobyrinate a,c-diamide synthase [Anaerolineae bacterium]
MGNLVARLVLAGTHSGVGKTTLTAGLIAALRQRGLIVQPFKVGPDYIDPSYHTLATAHKPGDANVRPCRNLDSWMIPPGRVCDLFACASQGTDIALIEGVMGLYDGFGYQDESGSTAQVARLLNAPVILVLDASHMARSAGALALGYQRFDPALSLAGFILNQVGSESHARGVAGVVEEATGLPVLGWLPRDARLKIPERHLGLVPTAEAGRWSIFIEAAAQLVAHHLDLDRLLAIARRSPELPIPDLSTYLPGGQRLAGGGHTPTIAVARDEAFSFSYEDNLDLLRAAGAEIAFFSPLHDAALPPGTVCIVLSGGFPELYAARLSENTEMQQALRQAHRLGVPVYAECGGLMYLTETITDLEGQEYPMLGLLPGRSRMTGRLTLGYRLAQAAGDSWLLAEGETVRGHEFHYSSWEDRPDDLPPAYYLLPPDGQGEPRPEGARLGNLWASYVHLHFWSKPELASRFVSLRAEIQ